jgi:hypothetical protein
MTLQQSLSALDKDAEYKHAKADLAAKAATGEPLPSEGLIEVSEENKYAIGQFFFERFGLVPSLAGSLVAEIYALQQRQMQVVEIAELTTLLDGIEASMAEPAVCEECGVVHPVN